MGDHDSRNGALAGNTFCADRQLQHIGAANIGDKTGRRCTGAFQSSITAIGFMGERPAIGHRLFRSGIRSGIVQHNRFTHSGGDDGPGDGGNVNIVFC